MIGQASVNDSKFHAVEKERKSWKVEGFRLNSFGRVRQCLCQLHGATGVNGRADMDELEMLDALRADIDDCLALSDEALRGMGLDRRTLEYQRDTLAREYDELAVKSA